MTTVLDPATVPIVETELVRDLRAARDLIAEGWCQGDYRTGTNEYCVLGAIYTVTKFWEGGQRGRIDDSLRALSDVIEDQFRPGYGITDWNDREGRTQAEVVAAFDRAILNNT